MVFSCPICCEDVKENDTIACPVCQHTVCKPCTRQYLLSSRTSQCMDVQCRSRWSEHFLRTSFPKSTFDKMLKPHLRGVIMDRERSWLPETMPRAALYNDYYKAKQERETLDARRVRKTDSDTWKDFESFPQYVQSEIKQYGAKNFRRLVQLQMANIPFHTYLRVVTRYQAAKRAIASRTHSEQCAYMRQQAQHANNTNDSGDEASDEDTNLHIDLSSLSTSTSASTSTSTSAFAHKGKYVMRCLKAGCNALIDDISFTCDMCNTKVCKDCRQILVTGHKCKEEEVKSVKAIEKDKNIKACPKCAERIYRPHGCDHMWCTACNTGFDWHTLQLISNTINTNPYYHQWKREKQASSTDASLFCGEDIFDMVIHALNQIVDQMAEPISVKLHRNTGHLAWESVRYMYDLLTNLNTLRLECNQVLNISCDIRPNLNRDIRIKYLCSQLSDKQFDIQTGKTYKLYAYHMEQRQCLSMFSADICEFMLNVLHYLRDHMQTLQHDFEVDYNRLLLSCDLNRPLLQRRQRRLQSSVIAAACNMYQHAVNKCNDALLAVSEVFGYKERLMLVSRELDAFYGTFVLCPTKHAYPFKCKHVLLRNDNTVDPAVTQYCPYTMTKIRTTTSDTLYTYEAKSS